MGCQECLGIESWPNTIYDDQACRVQIFEKDNFTGWVAYLSGTGMFNSTQFEAAGGVVGEASSIWMQGMGCMAAVYTDDEGSSSPTNFSEGAYNSSEFQDQ